MAYIHSKLPSISNLGRDICDAKNNKLVAINNSFEAQTTTLTTPDNKVIKVKLEPNASVFLDV